MDHDNEGMVTAATFEADEASEPPPASRDSRRSRRQRPVRAKTISVKRMPKRELELGAMLNPETDETRELRAERPVTRADCEGGIRPCPWVSCAHHLYLDVHPRTGGIKLNFPDLLPEQMTHSCALDTADRGGITLEETGGIFNLTRERIRQLEVRAMAKMAAVGETYALRDLVEDGGPVGKRRLPMLRAVPRPDPIDELDDEPENDEAPTVDDAGDWDLSEVEA